MSRHPGSAPAPSVSDDRRPWPSVVRSTVASCISTGWRSRGQRDVDLDVVEARGQGRRDRRQRVLGCGRTPAAVARDERLVAGRARLAEQLGRAHAGGCRAEEGDDQARGREHADDQQRAAVDHGRVDRASRGARSSGIGHVLRRYTRRHRRVHPPYMPRYRFVTEIAGADSARVRPCSWCARPSSSR